MVSWSATAGCFYALAAQHVYTCRNKADNAVFPTALRSPLTKEVMRLLPQALPPLVEVMYRPNAFPHLQRISLRQRLL